MNLNKIFNIVVFPAPLGPVRKTNSPFPISIEISSNTGVDPSYIFTTSNIWIIYIFANKTRYELGSHNQEYDFQLIPMESFLEVVLHLQL